ncbi:hypothetical protein H9P43_008922 [Blastocladiella emersonii ATCC 22665]|nr:hypothetical protein H9P43_008922 [Blastocladiella emersonii ATCC 22665]
MTNSSALGWPVWAGIGLGAAVLLAIIVWVLRRRSQGAKEPVLPVSAPPAPPATTGPKPKQNKPGKGNVKSQGGAAAGPMPSGPGKQKRHEIKGAKDQAVRTEDPATTANNDYLLMMTVMEYGECDEAYDAGNASSSAAAPAHPDSIAQQSSSSAGHHAHRPPYTHSQPNHHTPGYGGGVTWSESVNEPASHEYTSSSSRHHHHDTSNSYSYSGGNDYSSSSGGGGEDSGGGGGGGSSD